jgi:chemotaxis protein methyltransferase CheR
MSLAQRTAPPGGAAPLLADQPREFSFSDADFVGLARVAYDYAGISLSEAKRNLVYSRLSRRLRVLGLETFAAYRAYLDETPREIENFINSISTNHTRLFREAHHFDHLRTSVIQPFVAEAKRGRSQRLRIWSAGCSSGEEPFTIAAVICKELPDAAHHDVRILATDIDTEVLRKAERGEFGTSSVDEIPKAYASLFRNGSGDMLVADASMRALISFRRLNLMEQWPFRGPFDAIFCRNVMIYFDAPTKARLIDRFSQCLRPGGWLYIGHSESLIGTHPHLQSLGRTIYRRTA